MPTRACQRQPYTRGCGTAQALPSEQFIDYSETRGIGGPAVFAEVSFSVEATSPAEDQDFRLALVTTAIDDEVLATAHGPGLFRGLSAVR